MDAGDSFAIEEFGHSPGEIRLARCGGRPVSEDRICRIDRVRIPTGQLPETDSPGRLRRAEATLLVQFGELTSGGSSGTPQRGGHVTGRNDGPLDLRERAEKVIVGRIVDEYAAIIGSALPEARQELRQKNSGALTPHQRTVNGVIEDHGETAPGNRYPTYRQRVEDPSADRPIRTDLDKLERYKLVTAEGTTRDRGYRIVGSDARSET